jgi:hypothetical protein
MAMSVLSVLAALLSLFFVSWQDWFKIALPIASVVPASAAVLNQLPIYRKANATWQTVQREFPSVVATFHADKIPVH